MSPKPLTDDEKDSFDRIRHALKGGLVLLRMTLDGDDVGVVCARRRAVVDGALAEGLQPLAILVDDATALRLKDIDGTAPDSVQGGDVLD